MTTRAKVCVKRAYIGLAVRERHVKWLGSSPEAPPAEPGLNDFKILWIFSRVSGESASVASIEGSLDGRAVAGCLSPIILTFAEVGGAVDRLPSARTASEYLPCIASCLHLLVA